MSDPDTLRSVLFEDPSDLEMDDLAKAQSHHQIETVDSITRCSSAPSWHFPLILSLPTVPIVVSKLSVPASNNIAITSIIPTDPLFPPCLQPQRPYNVGEDIMEVGRRMCFIRIEDRNDIYYWITCRMDNTGVEFSI